MQDDIQAVLSGMLADWHIYCTHTYKRAGYAGKAAGFSQHSSNSQYDWENGVESELVDKRIMEGFDAAANRVPQPYFTALQFEARNLAVRHQVWSSPRLPADRREREVMILEARVKLLKELARDGASSAGIGLSIGRTSLMHVTPGQLGAAAINKGDLQWVERLAT